MAERSDSKSKQPFTYPIEGRSLTVICNIPSGEYFAHPYEHLILRFVGVGKDIGVTCYNLLLTNPKREKLMNHNIAFLALGDLLRDAIIYFRRNGECEFRRFRWQNDQILKANNHLLTP